MPRPHTIHPDNVAKIRVAIPDARVGDVWELSGCPPMTKTADKEAKTETQTLTIQRFWDCVSCPVPMFDYVDADGVERKTSVGVLLDPSARRITEGDGVSWRTTE